MTSITTSTAVTPELIAFIDANAKKTEAWVDAAPGRWAAYPVAEEWYLKSLADEGITTVEQYVHNSLVNNIFEYWRSVRGYKPSWAILNSMSTKELEAELALLDKEHARQKEWEESYAKERLDTAWAEARELASRLGQSVKTLIKWGVLDKRELYPA
jgi:hypothetical protein